MYWLNPSTVFWDDWILFAAQLLTLTALVIYVWKTWEMAAATRRASEASAAAVKEAIDARFEALAPRILVYLGSDELQWAEVIVENRGQGTAVDLQMTFDPPLQTSQGNWNPNRYFETPKSVFPPGYRIAQSFDSWPSYFSKPTPRRYEVRLSYQGKENARRYTDLQILDVQSIEHRTRFNRKTVHDLVGVIEKATSVVERGLKALNDDHQLETATDIYTHEPDRQAEAYAKELVAAFDAGAGIEEVVKTRFWWEPLLRGMRTTAFQGYQAAVRDGTAPLRDDLLAILALLFVPSYLTDEAWEAALDKAVEVLRTHLALPERSKPLPPE